MHICGAQFFVAVGCCTGSYFREMPWAAIPFGDVNRRRALATRLGVRGIPTLTTIDRDGVVINQTAKGAAIADAKVRQVDR